MSVNRGWIGHDAFLATLCAFACSGDPLPGPPSSASGGVAGAGGEPQTAGSLAAENGGKPEPSNAGAGGEGPEFPEGGSAGEATTPLGCTLEDVAPIFGSSCGTSICHELEGQSKTLSKLDLIAPGVEERLLDQPSTDCAGKVFVDSENFEASYLLEKLENQRPSCGSPMPIGLPLSTEQLDCLRSWVESLAEPR